MNPSVCPLSTRMAEAVAWRLLKVLLSKEGKSMSRQSDPTNPQACPACTKKAGRFNEVFRKLASSAANAVGSKWAFIIAVLLIALWAASYPLFKKMNDGFNTWQLVINTLTTIITFLMVFLIQNTQNRDAKALHLKLDELIRGVKGARTRLVNLQECSDEELEELQQQFERTRLRETRKVENQAEEAKDQADHATQVAATAQETARQAKKSADAAKQAAHRNGERPVKVTP
jgi:low affinity Fe/Cu permease